eukprot:jgi/Mesvir1/28758/Mv19726-RA.1
MEAHYKALAEERARAAEEQRARLAKEKQMREREARAAAAAAAAERAKRAEAERRHKEDMARMERERYERDQARARERAKKPSKHWFTGAPYAPAAPTAGHQPPPSDGRPKAYSSPLFGDEWREYMPNAPKARPAKPKPSAAYEDFAADMRRERARSAAYEDFFSGRWNGRARSSAGPSAPPPSSRPAGYAPNAPPPRAPPPRAPPHRPPPAARTDEWSGAVLNAGVNLQKLTAEDRKAVEELQRKARDTFGQLPTTASGWRKGSFKFHPDKVLNPVAQKIAEELFKSYGNKHAAWKEAHNLSQKRVRRHVKTVKKRVTTKGARRRSRL